MIESLGFQARVTAKKLNEGHPNVVDVIRDGSVKAVINTLSGGLAPMRDGFHIRRAAVERRIPCFTSIDTATAAVRSAATGTKSVNILPLPEYLRGE